MLALVDRLRARRHSDHARWIWAAAWAWRISRRDARLPIAGSSQRCAQKVAGRGSGDHDRAGTFDCGRGRACCSRACCTANAMARKEFVIVDAAHERSDPAGAVSVASRDRSAAAQSGRARLLADVVGPVCEIGRFSGARPGVGECHAGRSDGGLYGGRVWICGGFELQLAARGPPKCWWRAISGGSFASARLWRIWSAANSVRFHITGSQKRTPLPRPFRTPDP